MQKSNDKHNLRVKSVSKRAVVKPAAKSADDALQTAAKGAGKRGAKSGNSKVSTDRLEMLVTIINRDKAEFYQDLLQRYEVNMQLAVRARGTARQQTLSLLGLESLPKTAIFSFIKESKVQDALSELENKFKTIKGGEGVAYTVPLTSVIGVAIFGFLSNNEKTVKEDKQ